MSDTISAICGQCFAFQTISELVPESTLKTPGPSTRNHDSGLCLLFGRPRTKKHDPTWPKMYGSDGACEAFRVAHGVAIPDATTLASYPASAIETVTISSGPTEAASVWYRDRRNVTATVGPDTDKAPDLVTNNFLTVAAVAKRLGRTPEYVYYLAKKGRLVTAEHSGKGLRVTRESLEVFLASWKPRARAAG